MMSAMALLITAGNAFAFTSSLSVGGNGLVVDIPLSGGTFDVRLDILRGGDTNSIGNGQTDFVADVAGITINGSVGGTTLAGTGTRYNQVEWDANTGAGAQNPNTTLAGVMAAGVPRGVFGTLYNGSWTAGDSFFGILNVTLAAKPLGTLINLSPTNGIVGDDQTFEDLPLIADGVTFHYTPEPASALLLLGALPFLRRRQTA
jgi:hypothetical protein